MDDKQIGSVPIILLLDSNERRIATFSAQLSCLGLQICHANSASEAVEVMLEEEVALVLIDDEVADEEGVDAATIIRRHDTLRKVPILFIMTSMEQRYLVKHSTDAGAVDYLLKPINAVVLLSKVNVFLAYFRQQRQIASLMEALAATQRKLERTNKELETVARYDPVTQLANRLDFTEFLASELEQAKRYNRILAVLFLDVDNFKYINDNYGHQIGDELLFKVACRLKDCLRKSDLFQRINSGMMISRLGGDEFALVLSQIDKAEDAATVARRVIAELADPFEIADGVSINLTVSVGIASFPFASQTAEGLSQCADMAMYEAKKLGKNTYHYFSEALNTAYRQHMTIEDGIRQAIAGGEFYMAYQPILDLSRGRVVAVESLCRCRADILSDIPIQTVVEVAEEAGLMQMMGEYLFRTTVYETKKKLFSLHPDISVHINLSTKQLQDTVFIEYIEKMLIEGEIDPTRYAFELTETAVMRDTQKLGEYLNRISKMGFEISIDDFGTGYSSLAWLRHLPIKSLKIDKEFVDEVETNRNDAILTKSIVTLADNLELTSIAEGIETQGQLDFLKAHHCPFGQGYFFAKPMPMDDLLDFLKSK